MQDGFQSVLRDDGNHRVNVIRHHAPGKGLIAISLVVVKGVSHDSCDSGVVPIAVAQPPIKTPLGLFQQVPQRTKTEFISSDRGSGRDCLLECLTLLANTKDQLLRE